MIGRTLSHYKVLEEINRGGMGVIYKALDLKLNREVALKVLPAELVSDPERKRRLMREARAAAALKHPNIGVIYEADEVDGVNFIAMELIEGESLTDVLRRGRLPVSRIIELVTQIAEALGRAHEKGIIHRDLKPANVMLTEDGHPKVIDFGLAKLFNPDSDPASALQTEERAETRSGVVMGTVSYMSPEQALGQHVDARSDFFSLGVMLYEMETGVSPFKGETPAATYDAILHKDPESPRKRNPAIPERLEGLTLRLLQKDPADRFQSARELVDALVDAELRETVFDGRRLVPALGMALLLVGAVAYLWHHSSRVRWAEDVAIPEIERLVEAEDFVAAFERAEAAEAYIPEHEDLAALWPRLSRTLTIETEPGGADVYYRDYGEKDADWLHLGKTPIVDLRFPKGFFHWKLEKPGFEVAEAAAFWWFDEHDVTLRRELIPKGSPESGMVRVEARTYLPLFNALQGLEAMELDAYFIDKFEVTNAQFKKFVDAGGYGSADYWKHDFMTEGRTLDRDEAMNRFVDQTGRAGPATWELGDYPDGRADYPVAGVSWYEASAYCEFVGKILPTLYHWGGAAETMLAPHIVRPSNFNGTGAAAVGTYSGPGLSGAYDLAGNVKEWISNRIDTRRYILGGSWDEPVYMFNEPDAQDPFRRELNFGFRCMKMPPGSEIPAAIARPLVTSYRALSDTKPVTDDVFEIYKSLARYDPADLHANLEWRDDNKDWILEKVVIDAAYGNERMAIYLFLPRNVAPPFQTVVYFPGSAWIGHGSSEEVRNGPSNRILIGGVGGVDFIPKAGRALVAPVFKGTLERSTDLVSDIPNPSTSYRDHFFWWVKDLGRTIDYIESRPDLSDQVAYYGFSWGGAMGASLPALEDRLEISILVAGGFWMTHVLPEADEMTYAPRVSIPTLMLNGSYDFFFNFQKTQKPMVETLGTPPEHKRHIVFESGHAVPRNEAIKEILDWLDTYFGPVS